MSDHSEIVDQRHDRTTQLILREERRGTNPPRYSIVTDRNVVLLELPAGLAPEDIGRIYRACVQAEWLGSYRTREEARQLLCQEADPDAAFL